MSNFKETIAKETFGFYGANSISCTKESLLASIREVNALLENQKLFNKSSSSSSSFDTASFNRFTIPLMKNLYPASFADKLIGVQPMPATNYPLYCGYCGFGDSDLVDEPSYKKPSKYRDIDADWEG